MDSVLTPAEVRSLFPAVQRATYLNAAASSPIALPVERAMTEHLREAVEQGDVGFRAWLQRKEEIRSHLARLVGARGPDEVGFVPSTSIGFSAVAHVMKQLGVREIVTLEGEFPSSTIPFLHQGFQLRFVRPRADGSYHVEDIARAVRSSTGALVASAVQFSSGARLDLAAAGALCRERNLLFAINGAQGLGQVRINMAEVGADFLCAPSHKWLMGGYGAGLFVARRELLAQTQPLFGGWLSVADPMAMDNLPGATVSGRTANGGAFDASGTKLRHDASALEAGGMAWAPLFGLGAAIEVLDRVGIQRIEAHNAALQARLREKLRARGFVPNAPDDPRLTAGICVFPVNGSASEAAHALHQHGVVVTPRGGGVRASTHVFNNEDDVDRLLWALQQAGIAPAA